MIASQDSLRTRPRDILRRVRRSRRSWQLFAATSFAAALLLTAAIAFAEPRGPEQSATSGAAAQADTNHPGLTVGSPAPDFTLPGVDGKTHKLGEYANAKVLAVVFECNTCAVSELYESRIEKLYQDYKTRGVALVAINPNNPDSVRFDEESYTDMTDSLDDMKVRVSDRHLDYPYLYDGDKQTVAAKYGPSATPEIFIFDQARKLQYAGRIDDNLEESLVKSQDARNAIDALLAGQPVALATTPAFGCSPKWKSDAANVAQETAKINAEPVTVSMASTADLGKLRTNPTGKLLLVNFWATWCGPCVSEFPDLQATYRMYRDRGLAMVTVSENDPEEKDGVIDFLQKMHASTTNMEFALSDVYAMQESFDHNMGAAVPFTVLMTPTGDIVYQEQGDVTIPALRRAILANLPEAKDYPGLQAYWSDSKANASN